ncbi:TonB-dependent receptor [Flavobacteriales bacterium 34_180_T64]|nr:TonB-dependent receptor [Flavobacteriales bacterium 34_180_T64]
MKNIIYVLLFFAIPTMLAQHSIKGIILDANTNVPIVFANVYIPQLEKGSLSNEHGEFLITDIQKGTYKIVYSIIGYETLSQTISLPNEHFYTIELSPSAIEMEEIIVSTPFHKLQSENVMKVEQKKLSDLKSNGAITLSDGITSIAGVESVTTGISIGKPVIRGLSSNRVLVYTQGIRLENQQFGDEHGLGINEAGIESVEVIKGPASLLYGSDALGGVLYLNPERFAASNTSAGTLSGNYFSNTQGYNTSLGYKSSGSQIKLLFRGSFAAHSDYKTKNYRVTNTRFKEQDFKAGLGYQVSKFKTEFRYNLNNSKLGIPENIGVQTTDKTPLLPYQELTNHIFSSKSVLFFSSSKLDLNLGYIYNNRKEFEDHDDDEGVHSDELYPALHMKLKTFNYDLKYYLPEMGKFETIIGVQGLHQTNANYGEEELIPNATTNDIGILATSHVHFETLDLQLGVRFDSRNIAVDSGIEKSFNSFNTAIGIKTDLFKNVTSRLNFASGYRAPNLAELTSDGTHEGTNRYEIGDPNLNNEQNFQIDLALEYKNDHLEVFANVFYNYINDYIFLSPNGFLIDGAPAYSYIQDNARLIGGEFGIHFHPHPLDWLHVESSFETVSGKQDNSSNLPLIPASSIQNNLKVEFERDWIKNGYVFLKLRSTFNQNNMSAFETSSRGYNLLGAGFGGTIEVLNKPMTITIAMSNLTNKTYIHHLSRLKTDAISNIGRNISFGITYHI